MNKNAASILVVDDEREIVRLLRRSLTAHGYTVLTASSGEEAIELVSQQRKNAEESSWISTEEHHRG